MFKSQPKTDVGGQVVLIPHNEIKPNPNQPRTHFDYDELEGLAQSIRANGILQPIILRKNENEEYELVSGERRLRAARMIGLNKIPSLIIDADSEKSTLFSILPCSC